MPSPKKSHISDLHWQDSIVPQKWTACNPTEPVEWLSSASHITRSRSTRRNIAKKKTQIETNILVAGRWQTQMLIGAGSFGDVYQGLDTATGQGVAIKVETASEDNLTLRNEMLVYDALSANGYPPPGFARMLHFEQVGDNTHALVLQRLGRSLEDIRAAQPEGHLAVQQVVQVGIQCLDALQRLHDLGFVHCDVKPDNILEGVGRDDGSYFLVDFGLAAKLTPCSSQQVEAEEWPGFVGTALYASLNVHEGRASSKKCDVESLAYSLAELLQGKLPWGGSDSKKLAKNDMRREIAQRKRATCTEQLFGGMGKGFEDFFEEVRALGYEECPNYEQLRCHLLREQSRFTHCTMLTRMSP